MAEPGEPCAWCMGADEEKADRRGSFSTNTKNLTPEGRKSFGLPAEPPKTKVFRPGISTDALHGEGSVSWPAED